MGIFGELRSAADILLLGTTMVSAERYRPKDTYGSLALSLAGQVQRGSCDPVVAEAALNDHSPENFVNTTKGERGAQALERLVLKGTIDPLSAEGILDRSFSARSVYGALKQIKTTD